ncbi:hypothetical protein [Gracilibacillus salinarum]|uniref:Uncharacterized protein n=1 Tax=Gracilibacillus salinarum TaxID=2932255 RepID=A0ABY4GMU8_9BACI|nr:hypothetical protein [Gracilibacillus salinarum]UOQ85703.1 hypothetical protein MUN87_02005 [Gracilibacillus salinarum]
MEKEFISFISAVISAGIAGLVTLVVLFINQLMQHKRWRENMQRKGEDKYLEKKLDTLHEANIELFKLANETLSLARDADSKGINDKFDNLNNKVRLAIELSSPYLNSGNEREIDEDLGLIVEISEVFELLALIRGMLQKEIDTTDKEIETHLLWLNEAIWGLRDHLSFEMKNFDFNNVVKPTSNKILKWTLLSLSINIFYTIYIIFILI